MFLNNNCDCDPPLVVGVAFVALATVTITLWALRRSDRYGQTVDALRLVGWTALVIAALGGAIRAISDVSDIL